MPYSSVSPSPQWQCPQWQCSPCSWWWWCSWCSSSWSWQWHSWPSSWQWHSCSSSWWWCSWWCSCSASSWSFSISTNQPADVSTFSISKRFVSNISFISTLEKFVSIILALGWSDLIIFLTFSSSTLLTSFTLFKIRTSQNSICWITRFSISSSAISFLVSSSPQPNSCTIRKASTTLTTASNLQ